MAATKGQGNPKWGQDEVLLALDLYLSLDGKIPGPADPRIQELSRTLRGLPLHAEAKKNGRFRNPDGVAFKLQNIHQVATGKGLGNFSATDQAVWDAFGSKPDLVQQLASQIRAQAVDTAVAAEASTIEDDESFLEGRVLTAAHKVRERDPALRRKVLRDRGAPEGLRCDCCTRPPLLADATLREAEFECHHKVPLSVTDQTVTRVADIALLCASCHRLIHRLMQVRRSWLSVEDLQRLISNGKTDGPPRDAQLG